MGDSTKTLIIRDEVSLSVEEGYSEWEIETLCFSQELKPPSRQIYSLSNIKPCNFKKGMSQAEVWEMTKKHLTLVLKL